MRKHTTYLYTTAGNHEIRIPREGHKVEIEVVAPLDSLVQLEVGGVGVWMKDVNDSLPIKCPTVNMIKTDLHSVTLSIITRDRTEENKNLDIDSDDIYVYAKYALFEDINDIRRFATEGLPNIHGWEWKD